jgi:putative Mg2+ transporter-C (MgtC) family protein
MDISELTRAALPELKILGQALIALALGGAIGWERETAGKWAGFRTHMLVCVASTLFAALGLAIGYELAVTAPSDALQPDSLRIMEAIVTGIAFIGAGTVFRDRTHRGAQGITTAATLLVVGPIGIAVATHRYVVAVGTTLLVIFVLRILGAFETRVLKNDHKDPQDPQ